jgi:trigger factor
MRTQIEKLSPVLVQLVVEVPAEAVAVEVDSAYQELRRKARVPGFRRGKAPKHVLQHLYATAIHADVAKRLVDNSLQQAFQDEQVQPLTQPDVEPGELRPDASFSFKARFEVRPEIAEVRWEGLEAKRPSTEVTDTHLEAEVAELRQQHATLQPVESREARKGDVASLALEVEIEGKPLTEEVETEIGSGQLLAPIDEALGGMKVGEHKTVEASLPSGHPNPKLRGKRATFKVMIKELKERVLPSVDDEFAKDCGEYASLDALRTALREQVKKRLEQKAEEEVARQLVVELCKANTVPVPPSLVEQQARLQERELAQLSQMGGRPFQPNEQLRQRIREDAEMKVRAGLLMAEIAKAKSMTVSEEDIDKGYAELAEQTGKNVAKVKAEYSERSKREQLIGMILEDKILDLIEGAAKIGQDGG